MRIFIDYPDKELRLPKINSIKHTNYTYTNKSKPTKIQPQKTVLKNSKLFRFRLFCLVKIMERMILPEHQDKLTWDIKPLRKVSSCRQALILHVHCYTSGAVLFTLLILSFHFHSSNELVLPFASVPSSY